MNKSEVHTDPFHRRDYNRVFWILAVLTAIEVALGLQFGADLPRTILTLILLLLALSKASLIAMYYMHLRWDNKFLAAIFITPLFMAVMLASFATLGR